MQKLNEKDPLTYLNKLINRDAFRPILERARPFSKKKDWPPFDILTNRCPISFMDHLMCINLDFFDLINRYKKLNEKDLFIYLNKLIGWDAFRPILGKVRPSPKKMGRPPFDLLLII